MYLSDINVLVYAFVNTMSDSGRYRAWLENLLDSGKPFGMTDMVLSGFLRIVTNPQIFKPAAALDEALVFIDQLTSNPHCVRISPGEKHWDIFLNLCKAVNARGNLITDAYFAAIAIESDCEWVTTNRDYALFPGLRWKHPLK
jgi:uncharacterized protein